MVYLTRMHIDTDRTHLTNRISKTGPARKYNCPVPMREAVIPLLCMVGGSLLVRSVRVRCVASSFHDNGCDYRITSVPSIASPQLLFRGDVKSITDAGITAKGLDRFQDERAVELIPESQGDIGSLGMRCMLCWRIVSLQSIMFNLLR